MADNVTLSDTLANLRRKHNPEGQKAIDEAKIAAETKAKADEEAKIKAETEAKAQADAKAAEEAKAKSEADAKAKVEAPPTPVPTGEKKEEVKPVDKDYADRTVEAVNDALDMLLETERPTNDQLVKAYESLKDPDKLSDTKRAAQIVRAARNIMAEEAKLAAADSAAREELKKKLQMPGTSTKAEAKPDLNKDLNSPDEGIRHNAVRKGILQHLYTKYPDVKPKSP